MLADTTIWCWGQNVSGQLGDVTLVARAKPGTVSGLSGGVFLSGGSAHVCAALAGGAVDRWDAALCVQRKDMQGLRPGTERFGNNCIVHQGDVNGRSIPSWRGLRRWYRAGPSSRSFDQRGLDPLVSHEPTSIDETGEDVLPLEPGIAL